MAAATEVAQPQIRTVAILGDTRDRGIHTSIQKCNRNVLTPLVLAQERNLRFGGWSVILTRRPHHCVGSAHVGCRYLGEKHLHVAGRHASLGETLGKHLMGSTIADVGPIDIQQGADVDA